MDPKGPDNAKVYVLVASPSMIEDRTGEAFTSQSNRFFEIQIPIDFRHDVRFNYLVPTWLADDKGSRDPELEEIELFRTSVLEDIEKCKPNVIIPIDSISQKFLLTASNTYTAGRGKSFPAKFGSHTCWVCPVAPAAFIKKVATFKGGDIPGVEQKRVWTQDIKRAIDLANSDIKPTVVDPKEFSEGLLILTDLDKALAFLDLVKQAGEFAFDIETKNLRPYYTNSKILTIGFAFESGGELVAGSLPVQYHWKDNKSILAKLEEIFTNTKSRKIAHNLSFEMEWVAFNFGKRITHCNVWGDTEVEAFVLDERPGSHDLGFLTSEYLGFDVKALSTVNVKKLEKEPINDVLQYNALDAKATLLLDKILTAKVKEEKLESVVKEHMDRIPTLIRAQLKGLLVDQDKVEHFKAKLGEEINSILNDIMTSEEAKLYEEKFGQPYLPSSPQRTSKLLKEILGVSPKNKKHKESTDKDALATIADDYPFANMLLTYRQTTKLKSTYVDSLSLKEKEKDRTVFSDGRLHPEFLSTRTVTGRLSSKGPNCQNYPSRKNKEIRSQIIAEPGHILVACDYAQIEARCIAMASMDKFLYKATLEGYDIHAEWANRVIKDHPKVYKARGSDFKAFRSQIKNELVFPLFYGSQPDALAMRLGITLDQAKKLFDAFWKQVPGVLEWQQRLMTVYKTKGYVETLTKRRRHAPMSSMMVYNTCIQGSSSDIVVNAMNRLANIAEETGDPAYQAILNIHDDLTFSVPEANLENYLDVIAREMTAKSYDWINLPLEIEIAVGSNWYDMKNIAKISTKDYEKS